MEVITRQTELTREWVPICGETKAALIMTWHEKFFFWTLASFHLCGKTGLNVLENCEQVWMGSHRSSGRNVMFRGNWRGVPPSKSGRRAGILMSVILTRDYWQNMATTKWH